MKDDTLKIIEDYKNNGNLNEFEKLACDLIIAIIKFENACEEKFKEIGVDDLC